MPRYTFQVFHNSEPTAAEINVDCETTFEARQKAVFLLPAASHADLPDGEMQSFRVVVRCQDGDRHYLASLIYAGMWLQPGDMIEPASPIL